VFNHVEEARARLGIDLVATRQRTSKLRAGIRDTWNGPGRRETDHAIDDGLRDPFDRVLGLLRAQVDQRDGFVG
jgi:hypothetical protein